jgi:hypothetical protein
VGGLVLVAIIGVAAGLIVRTPGVWGWPALWGFGGLGLVVGLIILQGVFEARRIRRVVGEALRGRPPLTDEEFGVRFFDPTIAPIAARVRRLLAENLECELAGMVPSDDFESWLQLSSGPDSAADTFFEELAIDFELRRDCPWPDRFGSFDALVRFVAANTPARPGVAGTPAPGASQDASPSSTTTPPGVPCQP